MGVSDDVLRSLDPIFKTKIHIYYNVTVQKIRANGKLRKCVFVVSAVGIHMLRKKNLRYKISCILSYFDLKSIFVAESKGSFGSQSKSIRISHESVREMGLLILSIRKSLFPPSFMPLDVTFDEQVLWCSPYDSRYAVRDRLLNCLLVSKADFETSFECILSEIPFENHVLHIRPNTLKTTERRSMYMAMSFTEELTTLSFESLKFADLFPDIEILLKTTRGIQTVVFSTVNFEGVTEMFLLAMHSGHMFHPNEIIFRDVAFDDSEFFSVLELLRHEPQALEFDHCDFSGDSLKTTVEFLNTQIFWKSLRILRLSDTPSSFVTGIADLPVLEELVIDQTQTDIGRLLEARVINSIHLKSITFRHGAFTAPTHSLPPRVKHLAKLEISNTKFSKDGLCSVFNWVSKMASVRELNLSNMSIGANDFTIVLQEISEKQFDLRVLIFDGNLLDSEQAELFCTFLLNQRNLEKLSIGDCFDTSSLTHLFNTIASSAITQISFASKIVERRFGIALVPFLQTMIDINRIRDLNIENQPLGKDGVKLLMRVIKETVLSRLSFDGIEVPSLDFLLGLCNAAVSSDMEYVKWPAREFERLIPTEKENASIEVLQQTIDTLKLEFMKEFEGCFTERNQMDTVNAIDIPNFDIHTMAVRNPEMEALFAECLEGTDDPLVPILLEFSDSLSLNSLCRKLSENS